jgi:hypothetical protein
VPTAWHPWRLQQGRKPLLEPGVRLLNVAENDHSICNDPAIAREAEQDFAILTGA